MAVGMFVSLCIAFAASSAQAGGLEYNGAGTRAAGRGGAFSARADDPMALQLNPALLADLGGTQVMLNLNVALYNSCVQRPGTYVGDDRSTYAFPDNSWIDQPYPEVCNDSPISPGASLVATFQLTDRLTLGVGVLTPYAAGAARFGGADGTVANGTMPSPVRYNMVSQNLLQIFPSVGVGYRLTPWLALGATLQWGITHISYLNYGAAVPGEEPAEDLRAEINVQDNFTPAFIGSVALRPTPSLDFMLGFRWVDNVGARGTVQIDSRAFDDPAAPNTVRLLENVRLLAPQTGAISFGARYGHRRAAAQAPAEVPTADDPTPSPSEPSAPSADNNTGLVAPAPSSDPQEPPAAEAGDRIDTEVFDVEFDVVYELNNRVNDFVVTLPPNPTIDLPGVGVSPLPTPIRLGHKWKNQWSLRLGGDYNVIPGTLALRAGASFETSGVNTDYVQLDFIPGQRVSVGGGATLRLGKIDVSLAYLHIFQDEIKSTATSTTGLRQIALGVGNVINQGTYTASFDVFSLGATYRF
jgi:long-chain fatty acid transport protein